MSFEEHAFHQVDAIIQMDEYEEARDLVTMYDNLDNIQQT